MAFASFPFAITLAILYTAGGIGTANGDTFSIDLIHRDSVDSPFYDSSMTFSQRIRHAIKRSEKLKLSKLQGASTPAEMKSMQNVPYALAVGSIIIFATSSTEAEYIAAFDASKEAVWEAVWVRKFIFGLTVVPIIKEPISMYCDNTGAISIANESRITKGARHFCAKVHYLREVIEFGDIKLEKVHTDDNLADPFTKALAFPKHSEHTKNIGMLPASSLM
nr:hypothetical protein [Tanacetum cinerariifolium]